MVVFTVNKVCNQQICMVVFTVNKVAYRKFILKLAVSIWEIILTSNYRNMGEVESIRFIY